MRSMRWARGLAAAGCGGAVLAVGAASAADPPAAQLPSVIVDGSVEAVAVSGSTAYIGGGFSAAGAPGELVRGPFVLLDASTGKPSPMTPDGPNFGEVLAAAPDKSG